jgi:hypothetical protein
MNPIHELFPDQYLIAGATHSFCLHVAAMCFPNTARFGYFCVFLNLTQNNVSSSMFILAVPQTFSPPVEPCFSSLFKYFQARRPTRKSVEAHANGNVISR